MVAVHALGLVGVRGLRGVLEANLRRVESDHDGLSLLGRLSLA